MRTGLISRYVSSSGSGSYELSSHFYFSIRGQQADCGIGNTYDSDVVDGTTEAAVDGANPPPIAVNQWRKQGLAVWSIGPTRATFWDSNTIDEFGPRGWSSVAPNASGTYAEDHQRPGDWGISAFQDNVRVRNILVRRYTEPEPTVASGNEERAYP